MAPRSEVKISLVRSFTECHRYAVASMDTPWDGTQHVSSWVTGAVRAQLLGFDPEPIPEDLVYDRTTKDAANARESVKKILEAVGKFEEQYKPEYMHRWIHAKTVFDATTLRCNIDAICRIDGEIVLLDLKTGRQPYAVWVQTALAGLLVGMDKEYKIRIDKVGLLHAPRVGPRTSQTWYYASRYFDTFERDIQQWVWTLTQLRQSEFESLAASPGMHCRRCPVQDCAVRCLDPKE